MLSRIAEDFASEIKQQYWSDAHTRIDKAGHLREDDKISKQTDQLSDDQTDRVRLNVAWVVCQVLKYYDPNLNEHEFVEACGVPHSLTRRKDGSPSAAITYGLRFDAEGKAQPPGKRI